jgi:adenylate kinase family enzyme
MSLDGDERRRLRVAIVGTCGSGKTTVADQLREWGYDAFAVGQEHSIVSDLWRRRSPDALIVLEVDYPTLQARRGESWPRALYDEQLGRLEDARSHATVVIDTSQDSLSQTLARVLAALDRRFEELG